MSSNHNGPASSVPWQNAVNGYNGASGPVLVGDTGLQNGPIHQGTAPTSMKSVVPVSAAFGATSSFLTSAAASVSRAAEVNGPSVHYGLNSQPMTTVQNSVMQSSSAFAAAPQSAYRTGSTPNIGGGQSAFFNAKIQTSYQQNNAAASAASLQHASTVSAVNCATSNGFSGGGNPVQQRFPVSSGNASTENVPNNNAYPLAPHQQAQFTQRPRFPDPGTAVSSVPSLGGAAGERPFYQPPSTATALPRQPYIPVSSQPVAQPFDGRSSLQSPTSAATPLCQMPPGQMSLSRPPIFQQGPPGAGSQISSLTSTPSSIPGSQFNAPILSGPSLMRPAAPVGPTFAGPYGIQQQPLGPMGFGTPAQLQPPQLNSVPQRFGEPSLSSGLLPPKPSPMQNVYDQAQQQQQMAASGLSANFAHMNLNQPLHGYQDAVPSKIVNLAHQRNVLPPQGLDVPVVDLPQMVAGREVNTFPGVFRSTLNAIPQTNELLKKSRLPLGLILHPFKDLKSLSVLQTVPIVRCRSCRAYINPFAQLLGSRRWRCNLCFRENDLPDEFHYDPRTKTYGEADRRPEMRETTVEFVATSEYMLRAPQAASYIYIFDVSANAVQSGYLQIVCKKLLQHLDRLPGGEDKRICFITVDSSIHFYQFLEGMHSPRQMIVTDLEDAFVPANDGFLARVDTFQEEFVQFLEKLPEMFEDNRETRSALGSAMTLALQILQYGGRITVMQTALPNLGPGALEAREDPNLRSSKEVKNLGPATDFYKRLSLECSGKQVAVDLYLFSTQYGDLATLSEIAKFNGGCIHYYPSLDVERNPVEAIRFSDDLDRYLTRKIGFEAVLRVRCTRGLSLHTFHGNAFVRSTDLLALPNINPDAAFGIQLQFEDSLETNNACFQAALLYTSSKGQRRIRVHTLCLPVTSNLSEVHAQADPEAVICMLSRMAVDRSINGTLSDAREALVNACVDSLGSFNSTLTSSQRMGNLLAPAGLSLLPLFTLGLLKHPAFNYGTSIKLDSRVAAMCHFKSAPILLSMLEVYPKLYPLHTIDEQNPDPPLLQLSYEKIDRNGVYLMDAGSYFYVYIGSAIDSSCCAEVFGVSTFAQINDDQLELPELSSKRSELIRSFVKDLRSERPFSAPLRLIKDDSPARVLFVQRLVDDKSESAFSYVEFVQFLLKEVTPAR